MDRQQLVEALVQAGMNPTSYYIEGAMPRPHYLDEVTVLEEAGGRFTSYYLQHGRRTYEEAFDSEDAACRSMLATLTRPQTPIVLSPEAMSEARAKTARWVAENNARRAAAREQPRGPSPPES